MKSHPDYLLWSSIRGGDQAAFEHLFGKYYGALCDFSAQFLKDRELAEETVADVFLTFWEKRQLINIDFSVRAYLYKAVKNRSLNKINTVYRFDDTLEQVAEDLESSFNPLDQLLFNELNIRVDNLLNALPKEEQLICRLRLTGLTMREISEVLSISTKTIEYRLLKSISFLQRQLEKYWNS
jgi:RNA polymerase sigma-70 factor (ECF subfamily)